MVALRNELSIANNNMKIFCFNPSSLNEAIEFAKIISDSGLCPSGLKGRYKDILLIMQTGAEVGLRPTQSLRAFGIINGRPFAWGDGLFALTKAHPNYLSSKEWYEGDFEKNTYTAYCSIKTKDGQEVISSFSQSDATRAGLLDKQGPWKQYPKRMLQMRARSFACRDAIPSASMGILSQDEAFNIDIPKVTIIQEKGVKGLEEALGINDEVIEIDEPTLLNQLKDLIIETNTPTETIDKWLDACNVITLDQLNDQQLTKAINHLKNKLEKETQNEI